MSNLKDILENNCPVFFTSIKVTEGKDRDYHKLKETKEIWQLNPMRDPGLNPGPEKWHYWENW